MTIKSMTRARQVLRTLPNLFNVQPSSDYRSLVSRSSAEITRKAWSRTGQQLRFAIGQFENVLPDAKQHESVRQMKTGQAARITVVASTEVARTGAPEASHGNPQTPTNDY